MLCCVHDMRRRALPLFIAILMVGWRAYSTGCRMQPTWGRHQEATHGSWRRLVGLPRWHLPATAFPWRLRVGPRLLLGGFGAQVCKVSGPSFYLLEWICVTLSLFAYFDCFSYVFHVCVLQMHNSPKPMEFITLKPYY